MRSRLAAAAFAASLLASAPAWADHAEAVTLFDQGRKLRDEGKFVQAAAAFERSLAAEQSIGAYYNLGLVYEHLGKPREAALAYRSSRELAHGRGDAREKEAVDALTKLLDASSYVKVEVEDKIAQAPGLQIKLDGEVVPKTQFNSEIFRAREQHEIVVNAFGHKELRMPLKNRQVFSVALGEPVGDATPPPPPVTPPAETTGGGWGWQKWAGVGALGFGVAALTFTAIRGLGYVIDQSRLNDARASANANCRRKVVPGKGIQAVSCEGSTPVQQQANVDAANASIADYDANEQKAKAGAPLTVGAGIVGVIFVGAGIYLFATAPSSAREATTTGRAAPPPRRVQIVPHIGIRDASFSFSGTF